MHKSNFFSTSLKIVFTFLLVSSIHSIGFGQIVSGDGEEIKETKEKKKREKVNRDTLTGTTYYLTGLYTFAYRKFTDNSVYSSYTHLENQAPDHSGGATIGLLMPFTKSLSLDLGFTYFGHKEKYNYVHPTTDSTYFFSNAYMQIGIPIKLRYTYGDKFQVFGFLGVTPLNLLNVRFKESFTTHGGEEVIRDVSLIKDKLSTFNVMATAGFGITYNTEWIGFTLYPEYRQHLMNTYNLKASPFGHLQYALGVNLGMTLRF